MNTTELRQIADLVNDTQRIETERKNAEKETEVLGICQVQANKGLYEVTYTESYLKPEVLIALRGRGLKVTDKTDRSSGHPFFAYQIVWGIKGK